jgi:hypothetical protein
LPVIKDSGKKNHEPTSHASVSPTLEEIISFKVYSNEYGKI